MTRVAPTIVALVCVLSGAARADRVAAEAAAMGADKALAAKNWSDAERLYRDALHEDATFLPARYGLAQALFGEGETQPALEELRAFVAAARQPPAGAPDVKSLEAKAEKQIADLDAADATLSKLADRYVDSLLDFAKRQSAKDPELAEAALRRALKVRPGCPRAVELLQKMGKPVGELVDLFDGKSMDAWTDAVAPTWQIVDGELVGECAAGHVDLRSARSFDGDYVVRFEMRLVEELGGGKPCCGLRAAWSSSHDNYGVVLLNGGVFFGEATSQAKDRTVGNLAPTDFKKPIDFKQWHSFEFRMKGDQASALCDGTLVGTEKRPEARASGYVALQVQHVRVAFRKIQVELTK